MDSKECREILNAYVNNTTRSNDSILERFVYDLLNYLEGPELAEIWSALPTRFQEDPRLIIKLPCLEHCDAEQDRINERLPLPKYICCARLNICYTD